jgi:hypothetical protein
MDGLLSTSPHQKGGEKVALFRKEMQGGNPMRAIKRVLAIATLCYAALGGHAYAGQDLKMMAGNACQFTDPEKIIFSKDISFAFDGGRIRNVGTTDVTVVCPIVRDNINNTGVFSVGVRVDGAAGEFVLCTLISRDLFGKQIGPDDFETGGEQGPELLALLVNKSGVRGTYELRCLLPPGGSVINYQYNEPTPTEDLP